MFDDKNATRWYPFERLEVYKLSVKFRDLVIRILKRHPAIKEDDADQLRRSAKSTIRNICEGAGEFKRKEKARFYRMSLRSSTESGGSLKMVEQEVGPDELFEEAHNINYELVAKLTVLINNMTK